MIPRDKRPRAPFRRAWFKSSAKTERRAPDQTGRWSPVKFRSQHTARRSTVIVSALGLHPPARGKDGCPKMEKQAIEPPGPKQRAFHQRMGRSGLGLRQEIVGLRTCLFALPFVTAAGSRQAISNTKATAPKSGYSARRANRTVPRARNLILADAFIRCWILLFQSVGDGILHFSLGLSQ